MPAGLRALGDDHIGTEIDRATRLFDVHHLLHPQCADGVRALHQAVRIAQMKRYDRWAEIEDLVEANSTEEMACGGREFAIDRAESDSPDRQHSTGPQAVRVNRRDRLADHTAVQSLRLAKISRRAGRTRRSFGRSAAALERTTSLSEAICTVTLYS